MAKSLVEIIASVEAELAELKALQKRLEEVGAQLTGVRSVMSRADLRVGDKIRINGSFGIGLDQDGRKFEEGVYTVEAVEPDHYDGVLSVLLEEAGWVDYETIAKEIGIVRV
ncbi:hypothetical protein Amme3_00143 [Pseudomonas phage vB_PpuM-Amme-3]|uniref:Uncharacterized protein n=1 Tax=Pseudomonas phage vB_PpuM-Amme-3 TaxID=3132617 RepID=A0AAX4MXK5_9CAUD